jgi:septum site-determining protein MinC
MAIALRPEPPLAEWCDALGQQLNRAPDAFNGRPVVLDLSIVSPDDPDLPGLFGVFPSLGIQLVGVEGVDPARIAAPDWSGPPLITGLRPAADPPPEAKPAPEPTSLVLPRGVRSGQSVLFPNGDVTVLGAIASGAEVAAGGSIHVYGALRGRAIAGFSGNPQARIFCRKLEAELLAIDGLYRTADEMPASLRGAPAQAWLDGSVMQLAALG